MSFTMAAHAVRMLWLNRADALRLTLVPYIVVQAITLGIPLLFLGTIDPAAGLNDFLVISDDAGAQNVQMPENLGSFAFVQLLAAVGSLIAGAWLAVVWHRFVLLEEYPAGYVPDFNAGLVLAYVWRMILIAIAMLFVGLAGGVAVGVFAALAAPLAVVGGAALVVLLLWVSIRLSVVLPSAAIGTKMGFGEAWSKTEETQWSLLGATVLVAIFSMLVFVPALLLSLVFVGVDGTSVSPMQIVINVVFGWIATMLTVSLATTLYGVAVEGRQLT